MGKIFISYRRDDSADVTGRIFDRLTSYFGRSAVFMDVDNIPPGVDFRSHVQDVIGQSTVLLAIIGKSWCDCRDPSGQRRLEDPNDFVRIEIESALARGVTVVPLLVRDARMPGQSNLPDTLQPLVYLNAPEVRSGHDFHSHVDRLIRKLEENYGIARTIGAAPGRSSEPVSTSGSTAVNPGECPKCHRINPLDRKFCGGCGEPMTEPCFDCAYVNGAWDVFCGQCRTELASRRAEEIERMANLKRRVEELRDSGVFSAACDLLNEMRASSHPRLLEYQTWAGKVQPETQAAHQACLRSLEEGLETAEKAQGGEEYEAALAALSGIPEPYQDERVSLLRDALQQQLDELQAQSHDLGCQRECIEGFVSHRDWDAARSALLPMAELRERRLASFQEWAEEQLQVVLQQIAERNEQRNQCLKQANALLGKYDFSGAVRVLAALPKHAQNDEIVRLLARCRATEEKLQTLLAEFKRLATTKEYETMSRYLREHLVICPLRPETKASLEVWFRSVQEAAKARLAQFHYADAQQLAELVPESLRSEELIKLHANSARAAGEVSELKAGIADARKNNNQPRLLGFLVRYLKLRPHDEQARDYCSRAVEQAESTAQHLFNKHQFAEAITTITSIPGTLHTELLRRLLADARQHDARISGLSSEIRAAAKTGNIPSLCSALRRLVESDATSPLIDELARHFLSGPGLKDAARLSLVKDGLVMLARDELPVARKRLRKALANLQIDAKSPMSALVAYVEDNLVGLVWSFGGKNSEIYSASVSGDGRRVAVGGIERSIRILDAATGMPVREIKRDVNGRVVVAWSRDGTLLAAGDCRGNVWIISKGDPRKIGTHPSGAKVNDVAFSKDGKTIASCSDDGTIRLWNVTTGEELRKLSKTGLFSSYKILDRFNWASFTPDGKTLVSSGENNCQGIRVWDMGTGRELSHIKVGEGYTGRQAVRCISLSADGRHVAAIVQNAAVVWEVGTCKRVAILSEPTEIKAVEAGFSVDGRSVVWTGHRRGAAKSGATLNVYSLVSGRTLGSVQCADPPEAKAKAEADAVLDKYLKRRSGGQPTTSPEVRPSTTEGTQSSSPTESGSLSGTQSGGIVDPIDDEFELTLEDDGTSAQVGSDAGDPKDLFSLEFEVPALDEEPGSRSDAGSDSDKDIFSSDFDLALDLEFDEEFSLDEGEDEEDAAAASVARKPLKVVDLGDQYYSANGGRAEFEDKLASSYRLYVFRGGSRFVRITEDGQVQLWALPTFNDQVPPKPTDRQRGPGKKSRG